MAEDTVRAAMEIRKALLATSPVGLPEEVQIVANLYTVANLGDALVPAREGELSTEGGIPTWHVKVFRKKTRQLRGELHISQNGKQVEWKEKGDRDAPA